MLVVSSLCLVRSGSFCFLVRRYRVVKGGRVACEFTLGHRRSTQFHISTRPTGWTSWLPGLKGLRIYKIHRGNEQKASPKRMADNICMKTEIFKYKNNKCSTSVNGSCSSRKVRLVRQWLSCRHLYEARRQLHIDVSFSCICYASQRLSDTAACEELIVFFAGAVPFSRIFLILWSVRLVPRTKMRFLAFAVVHGQGPL